MWIVQIPFPTDLLETDNPNIYITSPNSTTPHPSTTAGGSGFLPSMSISGQAHSLHHAHSLHSLGPSPGSSPTTADFPHHSGGHHSHHHSQSHTPASSLSRQHSFQHLPYESAALHHHGSHAHYGAGRYGAGDAPLSTPLPPSPGPMDIDERVAGAKRQRTAPSSGLSTPIGMGEGAKKSRARSDSAPLGYGNLGSAWGAAGRPRSGSGLGGSVRGVGALRREETVPNIGSVGRAGGLPGLVVPGVPGKS